LKVKVIRGFARFFPNLPDDILDQCGEPIQL
jgi:hypothetical protein